MKHELGPPTVPSWLATVALIVFVLGVGVIWHYEGDLNYAYPVDTPSSLDHA